MAAFSLSDLTSWWNRDHGSDEKPAAFTSQQEAYSFVRRVYKETNGATPALRKLHEEYVKKRDASRSSNGLDESRV